MVSNTGDHITLDIVKGVARITLNRPAKMNAFTPESYSGLGDAVEIAGNNDSVNVICITGAGEAFSTGGDLRIMKAALFPQGSNPDDRLAKTAVDADLTRRFIEGAQHAFEALESSPKVVIAAVNGACHGGGLGVALCADFIIATDKASFRAPEGLIGVADPFLPVRLARRVGTGRARLMLFTGEPVDAISAPSMGLVDELVTRSELEAAVERLVQRLAKTSPLARRLYKQVLNAELPPFDPTVSYIANTSDSAREGVSAFVEKRSPDWGAVAHYDRWRREIG
jgi:enoyl-CoA hydratase